MKTFAYEDVLAVAATLPKDGENPDPGTCYYLELDGSPACIAANILHRLDPAILPGVIEWDDADHCWSMDNWSLRATALCNAAKELGIAEFEDRAREFLDLAQSEADEGMSWGDAIVAAESL